MNFRFLGRVWPAGVSLTAWSVFLYVFMEWLFFATKPSFMSSMHPGQKLVVFFVAAFTLLAPILILHGLVGWLGGMLQLPWQSAVLFPAIILGTLALILLDNFTYTVFRFGIVGSQGIWRLVYAAALVATCFFLTRSISNHLRQEHDRARPRAGDISLVLFGISAVLFLSQVPGMPLPLPASRDDGKMERRPNIILLGIDGVNATHMSAYGYDRDTTPQIRALMSGALVAENAYSNAGKTGAALTSMLTGKLPTRTRVIFPPDILLGEDAYQHLPGILKRMGYATVQISMPYYGDAYQRNIVDGFDQVNYRSWTTNRLVGQLAMLGGGGGFYFAGEILGRAGERLAHIFFIKQMENPYAAVTQTVYATHDDRRFAAMLEYIRGARGPLFLHVHMMDTHGPEYYVPRQSFSRGETQDHEWMTDFYDDAILEADQYVGQLMAELAATGKDQDTLVILYSDHGSQWDSLQRVPLMFWFPAGQHAGRISYNAQLLDVAPTILDYLGLQQPSWMEGSSLLENGLPPDRRIFSADVGDELKITEDRTTWVVDQARVSPPFYDLGRINMVVCSRWYSLDLRSGALASGNVAGSKAVCKEPLPSRFEARRILTGRLRQDGYAVDASLAGLQK